MPNNPQPPRPIYRPAPDFNHRPVPITRQPQRNWFRVHRTGASAIQFGLRAHHRFSHANCPFQLLYVGLNLPACLWEYFGDDIFGGQRVISAAKWDGCSVSQISVPQLKVCAVSQEPTRDAMGVDKASLLAVDLSIPQAWCLAVQQHPAGFEAIKYSSRFIDQPCLALFDRNGLGLKLRETLLGPLNESKGAVDWLDDRNATLA